MDAPIDARTPAIDGIRIGVGGWTFVPWRDNFYPKGLVQRRELEYASRHLSTIEINGTFYRAQSQATYRSWRESVPDGFVFSAKAPMRIVQARVLARTGGQVEDFIGGIVALGDRLGPLLWQFDRGPTIDFDDFAAFAALLPATAGGRALRHVLDVRDPAFVDARFIALARQHGLATVFTDSGEYPSFADVTADFVYARLMRSQADCPTGYRPSELTGWAGRLRAWAGGGEPADLPRISPPAGAPARREVFAYFIGSAKARNPAAAMALQARLARD